MSKFWSFVGTAVAVVASIGVIYVAAVAYLSYKYGEPKDMDEFE